MKGPLVDQKWSAGGPFRVSGVLLVAYGLKGEEQWQYR
jgi:hypothetical protein